MGSFIRNHLPWVSALSTGIFLGVSSTALYFQLSRNLSREVQILRIVVEKLQQEISELRDQLSRKKRLSGYYSVQPSSGDEDEIFEEASEGGSDLESFQSTTSLKTAGENTSNSVPNASSSKDLYSRVDKLLEGNDRDKEKAYTLLRTQTDLLSGDAEYLWRFAKSTYLLSQIEEGRGNDEKKKALAFKAKDVAFSALSIDENCANVHKWCALTLGNLYDYQSTQAKILDGNKFREHIEKAISLNPKDPSSHYLLGRWCYGVYMLTWLERKVAATLFATPPSATVDEALVHFLDAENLNPGSWKENMLYIAKCYIEKGRYEMAVEWMEKGSKLASLGQDDRVAQKEIDTLLAKYRQ